MNSYKKIERLEKIISKLTEENNKYQYEFINLEKKQKLADEKYDEYCKLVNEVNAMKSQYKELIKQLKSAIKQQPKTYKHFDKEFKKII